MTVMYAMFGAAGLFGLVAAVSWVRLVLEAFRTGRRQGVLSLLVPGYVAYFALARPRRAKRVWTLGGAVLGLVLAGVCFQLSTAFAPEPSIQSDLSQTPGFQQLGSFDDLGNGK